MARIDEEAARREIERAGEYTARADELLSMVDFLRERARDHLREADELVGARVRERRVGDRQLAG
jgi:hypothetical protein